MVERTIIAVVLIACVIAIGIILRQYNRRKVITKTVHADLTGGTRQTAPTLLYFWSHSCAQCVPQQKAIEDAKGMLEESGRNLNVVKYNALESPDLAREMRVLTLPTTVWLDPNGQVTEWNAGLTRARTLVMQYDSHFLDQR